MLPPRRPVRPPAPVAPRKRRAPPPSATAERVKGLALAYLRARWRREPRIAGAHPSVVDPPRWIVTAIDPANSAIVISVAVDPLTGTVGLQ